MTPVLHICYTPRYNLLTPLLNPLLHLCYTLVIHLSHPCYTCVTRLLLICYTFATSFYTYVLTLLHLCYTAVTLIVKILMHPYSVAFCHIQFSYHGIFVQDCTHAPNATMTFKTVQHSCMCCAMHNYTV